MEENNRSRVDRILQKLEQVRRRKLSCFGSDSHGFRLNNPLSEIDLKAFESRHNIRLPDDYRTFLAHAGNGGAGPYYGIFPLDKWDDYTDWVLDERPDNFLALPCPLHPQLKLTEGWEDFLEGGTAYQGTLSLGSQGCTYAMQLVVSGSAVGRVIYVDAEGQQPYLVREPDFLSWYERWLDELLQGYKTNWFGYGISGDEDRFLFILNDLQADDELKSEAADFFNLKEAGALDQQELLQLVEQSPLGNLRSQAAYTIDWQQVDIPLLIRMLSDPDTQVRFYATLGLRKLKARNSLPQVLQLLAKEKEAHLVGSILKMLGEFQDRSTVPVLLEWAENEDDFHRLDAIDALIKMGDERVVPIVRSMLNETRCPQRRNDDGGSMSSVHSIGTLVRKSLNESPNKTLRM